MKKWCRIIGQISFFVAVAGLIVSCGITSRYRLDLFVASDDVRKKVAIEKAEIIAYAALNNPYEDYKTIAGAENVAIMTVTARWNQQDAEKFRLLDFDEYWRCKLFLELGDSIRTGTINLKEKSFLQLMGRYDVEVEDKIFLATAGSCSVDSLNSKSVFFTIDGKFTNRVNETLEFSGQFKMRKPSPPPEPET